MKIQLEENAVMPTRAHPYDAGLDLYAPLGGDPVCVPPFGDSVAIDTGVHLAIPQHFCGLIKSRSGLMVNHKILTDGTIDCGYTGSIRVNLFNHSAVAYMVHPGDKIAQLVILPCCLPPLEVVDSLEETDRGSNGFGSSGR